MQFFPAANVRGMSGSTMAFNSLPEARRALSAKAIVLNWSVAQQPSQQWRPSKEPASARNNHANQCAVRYMLADSAIRRRAFRCVAVMPRTHKLYFAPSSGFAFQRMRYLLSVAWWCYSGNGCYAWPCLILEPAIPNELRRMPFGPPLELRVPP